MPARRGLKVVVRMKNSKRTQKTSKSDENNMKKIVLSSVLIMLVSGCRDDTNVNKATDIKSDSAINEVNVYSARNVYLLKPLLDYFAKDTNITLNILSGKSTALHQLI